MPTKPVTKEDVLLDVWNKRVFLSDPARYECLRAMDSWAALQTGERDERIKELEAGLSNLMSAIPNQHTDYDWWPDDLTTAFDAANLLLTRPNGV